MQSPLSNAFLQNRLTAGTVSRSYTCGVLLFIQVYSELAQMQCSSAQGKMQSPLFSVFLQNTLTAGSVSLQSYLWNFALYTGVQ